MEANKRKNNNRNCCVSNCFSKAGREIHLSFHGFPPKKDRTVRIKNNLDTVEIVERRVAWEKAIRLNKPITPHMKVCSLHFRKEDFYNSFPPGIKKLRHVLLKTAVPSLNLPSSESPHYENLMEKKRNMRSTVAENKQLNEEPAAANMNVDPYLEHLQDNKLQEFTIQLTRDAGIQVDECSFREAFISPLEEDKNVLTLTGLGSIKLLDDIAPCVLNINTSRLSRFITKECVILVLMKLQCNMMFADLAFFFGTTAPTCRKTFIETIWAIASFIKSGVVLHSK